MSRIGRVCHKTLLNIGFWSESSREQKDRVIYCLNERYKNELTLFDEKDEQVVAWVNQFWNEMIAKQSIDRQTMAEKHRLVKVDSIRHKEAREIGTEWLWTQTWVQLQLPELLHSIGLNEEQVQLAMTQVISRAVYPGSEMANSKWIRENSLFVILQATM